jgi:hypothetical protein
VAETTGEAKPSCQQVLLPTGLVITEYSNHDIFTVAFRGNAHIARPS